MKRLILIASILALVACDKTKQSDAAKSTNDGSSASETSSKEATKPTPPTNPLDAPVYTMRKVDGALGVVFLLHGFGSNENNFLQFASKLQLPWTIVSLRAPIDLKRGRYAWFPRDEVDDPARAALETERVKQFIEFPPAEVGPAPKKVVLGFSQGAVMALRLAASETHADGFAALSGRWPSDLPSANKVSDAAYFVAHGNRDTVIRPEESERVIEKLREADQQVINKTYHMMGHTIGLETRNDVVAWINSVGAPDAPATGATEAAPDTP